MKERKQYKRSDNCILVHTNIGWNVLDYEQIKDLEFIDTSINSSRKIKECVRFVRMLGERTDKFYVGNQESLDYITVDEADENAVLNQLVD